MARTNATNFSGGLQFPYATSATDVFKKEDVQTLAQAVDQHDHTTGKGHSVNTTPANASITNAMLGPDVARANLLTNGGMEIWQRGPGPYTTGNTFGPDRWILQIVGSDTLSVTKDTTHTDIGSLACAAVTFGLGSGAGATTLLQQLNANDSGGLLGRTVSLSVRVRTSTANAVRVAINNFTGTNNFTYSSFHTGSGNYETLTVPAVAIGLTSLCQPQIFFAASCTAYIDNVMLVIGSQPADYVPLHPADDLARCLRYYETMNAEYIAVATAGSQVFGYGVGYKARKPVSPTATITGTWTVTNCAQPALLQRPNVGGTGIDAVTFYTSSVAVGQVQVIQAGGSGIVIEANP